ncbi:MAG: DUF3443 family protein [Leptospirillia bacterium]
MRNSTTTTFSEGFPTRPPGQHPTSAPRSLPWQDHRRSGGVFVWRLCLLLPRSPLMVLFLLFSGLAGCGGGTSGPSGPPAVYKNQIDVSLLSNQWNIPTVSVTLCVPGTSTCQTIDNILLDTGSVGLRISHSVLSSLSLPPVTDGGEDVYECYQFSSGSVFGPVVSADVVLGGEPAVTVDIQLSNDSLTPPSSCGTATSVTSGGVNGILGIGYPFTHYDFGTYYACSSSGCPTSAGSLSCSSSGASPCHVANPVFSFPSDNNGILLSLPSISSNGAPPPVYGILTFGLNTQSDNGLSGLTVFTVSSTNSCGSNSSFLEASFTNGPSGSCAFLDSGSNGLFFGTSTFTVCNTSWYCPSSTAPIFLTLTGANNTQGQFSLSVINEQSIANSPNIAWNNLAGPYSSSNSTFDAGLPFFFGRTVAVGYQTGGQTPFWAF